MTTFRRTLQYLGLGWHVPTLPQWYYGREPPPPASSWTTSCPDPVITGGTWHWMAQQPRASIGKSKVDYYLVGLPLTWQKKTDTFCFRLSIVILWQMTTCNFTVYGVSVAPLSLNAITVYGDNLLSNSHFHLLKSDQIHLLYLVTSTQETINP